jgi:hypothetical protein
MSKFSSHEEEERFAQWAIGGGRTPPPPPTPDGTVQQQVIPAPMVVGDLASDARGSGARANSGKAPLNLLPLIVTAGCLTPSTQEQRRVQSAVYALGRFQQGVGHNELQSALALTALAAGMNLTELMGEAARVLDYGRGKYAEWNWAKGMAWSVCIGCAARHLLLRMWDDPRSVDEESGCLHAGHVACNLLFLMQYAITYTEGDDRPAMLAPPIDIAADNDTL